MQPDLNALLAAWVASEPIASSALFIAALLLFWTSFARIWAETSVLYERIWRVFRLIASVALFLSLSWSFYFLLKSNNAAFGTLLTKLAASNPALIAQQETASRWGGTFIQNELTVTHYVTVEFIEEIHQGKDKNGKEKPTLYLKHEKEEILHQESLLGFVGDVHIHVVDPALAKYELQADYRYTVVNPSESPTIARFSFPFTSARLYENLSVRVDGKLADWRFEGDTLKWQQSMAAQQQRVVEISYRVQGAEHYHYRVPLQRVIQNFSLTVSVDSPQPEPPSYFVVPTSKAIQFTSQPIKQGYQMNWLIDRAILQPEIYVFLNKPAPKLLSRGFLDFLAYTGRALVLLLSLTSLTLILFNLRVDLTRLTLLSAVFAAQFLVEIALYPFWDQYFFLIFLVLGVAMVFFGFLLFRSVEKPSRTLILILTLLFAVFYPLVGSVLPGEREKNALDGAIQAGMILYIFVLTFYVRVRRVKPVPESE